MKVQKSVWRHLFSFTVLIQDSGGSDKNRVSGMTLSSSSTESHGENCDDSLKDIVETVLVVKKRAAKPDAKVKSKVTGKKSVEFGSYSSSTEQQNKVVVHKLPSPSNNNVTLKDIILTDMLMPLFTCLNIGTRKSKSANLFTMFLILRTFFGVITDKHLRRKADLLLGGNRTFTARREYQKKLHPNEYAKEALFVLEFLKPLLPNINENPEFKQFNVWDNNDIIDQIQNNNLSIMPKQHYCFDTTKFHDGCYMTSIIDLGTRQIVAFCITTKPPSSLDLKNLFDRYFTPELKQRCRVIHGDQSGANLSTDFRNYCKDSGFNMSFTTKKNFTNQVAESTNATLKRLVKNNKLHFMKDSASFSDLLKEHQYIMIEQVVFLYNNMISQKSSVLLQGFSRNVLGNSKELVRLRDPKKMDQVVLIAHSRSEEGKYIASVARSEGFLYCAINNQSFINDMLGTRIQFVSYEDVVAVQDLYIHHNREKAIEVSFVLSGKHKTLDKVLRSLKRLGTKNIPTSVIIDMMKALSAGILANAKTIEEKRAATLNMGNVLLHEIQYKESGEKHTGVLAKVDVMETEINTLKEENMQLRKSYGNLVELEESKALTLVRRDVVKRLSYKSKYAIYPEDVNIILEVIQLGENIYEITMYRLATILLLITGLSMSNLRFLDIFQLDNLFDKKTVVIKIVNRKNNTFLTFPYVEEMEPYLDLVRVDYKHIKNCQKEDCGSLSIFNSLSFNQDFNSILKAAGVLMTPKKNLSYNSFRRGITITAMRLLGLTETTYLLGHSTLSSTEFYGEEEVDLGRLKRGFAALHAIKDSKKAKYISYSPAKENLVCEVVETMCNNTRRAPRRK